METTVSPWGSKRRHLEIAVLAFGVLFVGLLALSFRPGRRPAPPRSRNAPAVPAPGESGQATTVLSGVDFTESLRGKPLFRIRSERTVGFGPGAGLLPNRYALEKVVLTVYPEQGSPVAVLADRAEYDEVSKRARLQGNVRWSDEDRAFGETERVEFHPEKRVLEIPTPIHFSRGTFELRASSGSYDVPSRTVSMAGPIEGSGTGEGSGGLTSLSADSAFFHRPDGVIELEGGVSAATREGDRLSSDRILLMTAQDGKSLEWARASGNVRGTFSATGPASLRPGSGAARAPPESGGATRSTNTTRAAESPVRSYAGDQAALFFAPQGEIRSFDLTGSPASLAEPERKIAAQAIDLLFAGGRAASAQARGEVSIRSEEASAPGASAESERASISFAPSGGVEMLELAGRVRMRGEGRWANAETAVQIPERGIWLLTGRAGSSATVESGRSRVSAARIEISRDPEGLRAEGEARAVFTPEPGQKARPTLVGDPSRPTYGKAGRMVFDEASKVASLSGGATLWQGGSSLFGDDITLNEAERTVVAVGHVRALLVPEPEPSRKEEQVPSVVTSRRMIYRDASHTALFEDDVAVTRGTWRAAADRGTAYLAEDQKIERVELAGGVTFSDTASGRSGRAERATDYPREGKTILEGKPASVSDRDGSRVTGATLTIRDRGRTVEVVPPEGGKTETIYRTRTF